MAKNILICDDAAFMRMMIKDILTKNGYKVKKIQPVDMFPFTDHVESVTLLEWCGGKK